jgi:hypothetical protein
VKEVKQTWLYVVVNFVVAVEGERRVKFSES